MKKLTRILLKIAAFSIPLGIALFLVGTLSGAKRGVSFTNWKISLNETSDYTYENYNFTGVKDIKVDVSNAKIVLAESENNQFGINANLSSVAGDPTVGVENGTLKFIEADRNGFNFFNFNWGGIFDGNSDVVTIYLPKGSSLSDVNLHTSNGRIEVDQLTAKTIKASSSNGGIYGNNLKISEDTEFTTSNGQVEIDGTFSGKTYVKSSNGKLIGTGKFSGNTTFKSSNGTIEFENSLSKKDCDIDADTSNGSIMLNGSKVSSDEYSIDNDAPNSVSLKTSNGSIKMNFR